MVGFISRERLVDSLGTKGSTFPEKQKPEV
jgi:hypothetical protein